MIHHRLYRQVFLSVREITSTVDTVRPLRTRRRQDQGTHWIGRRQLYQCAHNRAGEPDQAAGRRHPRPPGENSIWTGSLPSAGCRYARLTAAGRPRRRRTAKLYRRATRIALSAALGDGLAGRLMAHAAIVRTLSATTVEDTPNRIAHDYGPSHGRAPPRPRRAPRRRWSLTLDVLRKARFGPAARLAPGTTVRSRLVSTVPRAAGWPQYEPRGVTGAGRRAGTAAVRLAPGQKPRCCMVLEAVFAQT